VKEEKKKVAVKENKSVEATVIEDSPEPQPEEVEASDPESNDEQTPSE